MNGICVFICSLKNKGLCSSRPLTICLTFSEVKCYMGVQKYISCGVKEDFSLLHIKYVYLLSLFHSCVF